MAEMSLNGHVQRLIDIVRDGTERAAKAGDLLMRIERVGVQCVTHAEGPCQFACDFPGILHVEIEIEEVEWLVCCQRKSLARSGCHSINELRQGRIRDGGHRTFAKIVVVQAQDPGVRAKPEFVSAVTPCEVVVNEKSGGSPALNPGVVES